MALAQEDIDYIKAHLGAWLAEQSLGKPPVVYGIELRALVINPPAGLGAQSAQHMRDTARAVSRGGGCADL